MKYRYVYKSSNGVRHEALIEAKSRDEVFIRLRAQKIKPIKVLAADGSLDNGAVNGVRRRVVAFSVLAAVVATAAVLLLVGRVASRQPTEIEREYLNNSMRRQIIGDAAVIEKGIRDSWSDVFSHEGERFLSDFAIPGNEPKHIEIDEVKLREAIADASPPLPLENNGSIEARQMVAIVTGLKTEARDFMAAGGSVKQYCQMLVQRQLQEISYYNRAKNEIDNAVKAKMPTVSLYSLWEKRNGELRRMGIKHIPMPE